MPFRQPSGHFVLIPAHAISGLLKVLARFCFWGLCGTFGVISALESPRSSKRKIDILNPLSASHQAVADFEKMTKWFLKTACNHQSLPRFMFHICQVVPLLICHLMENQEKAKQTSVKQSSTPVTTDLKNDERSHVQMPSSCTLLSCLQTIMQTHLLFLYSNPDLMSLACISALFAHRFVTDHFFGNVNIGIIMRMHSSTYQSCVLII